LAWENGVTDILTIVAVDLDQAVAELPPELLPDTAQGARSSGSDTSPKPTDSGWEPFS